MNHRCFEFFVFSKQLHRKMVSKGSGKEIAHTIENGKNRPSKKLVETVGSLIQKRGICSFG